MVTGVLQEASSGDAAAQHRLLSLVYEELRGIARSAMSAERPGHTLQATALVNEAYVRLFGGEQPQFENRRHFFSAAAEAMRHFLVAHARATPSRPPPS